MFESAVVFDVQEHSYANFRIPVLCVTPQGTVLCSAEARLNSSDQGPIDLLLRRSTDGGRTFQEPQSIGVWQGESAPLQASDPGPGFHNCVLIPEREGTVHLLYGLDYARVFYRKSTDDGLSWSAPRDITNVVDCLRTEGTYPWRVVATGPGQGLQTSDGRLVVPCWFSRGSDGPGGEHRPSILSTLYSDDRGESWHLGDIVAHETDPFPNPSEAIAVELPDGRILLNFRQEAPERLRAIAFSPNGATQWTRPELQSDLDGAICHAGMVRNGDELLFSLPNPNTATPPLPVNNRKNLVVKLSSDGGDTWPVQKTVEPGLAGYSALGVLPDGTLLCLYELALNIDEPWILNQHVLTRFDRIWLESK